MVVMFVASEAALSAAVERGSQPTAGSRREEGGDRHPRDDGRAASGDRARLARGGLRGEYVKGAGAGDAAGGAGVLVRHYSKMGRAREATVQAHNEGAGSIESRLLVTGRELATGDPRA
jgi:hypothetical protein